MTPEEQLKQRVRNLMDQLGCSLDQAFEQALAEDSRLANKANKLLQIKQEIEWERRFG